MPEISRAHGTNHCVAPANLPHLQAEADASKGKSPPISMEGYGMLKAPPTPGFLVQEPTLNSPITLPWDLPAPSVTHFPKSLEEKCGQC